MTTNNITVCTTIDGARIGDDLVATSRHNAASSDKGRFVDIRIDALVLETSNGHRTAFAHEDWTFTVAPSAPPRVEAVEAWQRAHAPKPQEAAEIAGLSLAPSVEHTPDALEILAEAYGDVPSLPGAGCTAHADLARRGLAALTDAGLAVVRPRQNLFPNPAFREGIDGWGGAGEPSKGEPTAFEEHAAGLAASRLERAQELEAEVARLTALAENKQTVINEDREDAKRNRDLANQRADELVARIQELEVEAARHENALEKADGLIQALRRRYGTHVVLQRAQADDDRAARLIREADEQNSAARALTKQRPRTGGDPRVWALAPDAAGLAFAGVGTALDALNTFQLEPTADKFAKFLHIADLGEYTKVLERAAREMATEEQAGVEAVLNQILIELRRLGKRADTRARVARKASIR